MKDYGTNLEKAKKLIEELEKENIYSSFIDKYLGKLNIKTIDEESLYLQETIKHLKNLEKSEKQKKALEKLISMRGTLHQNFGIKEEDLYMQED